MTPLLLSGFGRSGSTALMALLGTDTRVAFDRIYPFECRYLTYLMKQSLLASRQHPGTVHDAFRMFDPQLASGSAPTWLPLTGTLANMSEVLSPKSLWTRLAEQLQSHSPGAVYYAEKAPYWLADQLRPATDVRVLHLVRDPRDVYLSVLAFARTTGEVDVRSSEPEYEANHARDMAYQLVCFAEAERADQGRSDAQLLRYEDWIAKPDAAAAALSQWLGLRLNAEAPELSWNVARHSTSGNIASSAGRWQTETLPTAATEYLLPALGDMGRRYQFELPTSRPDIMPDPRRPHSPDADWSRGTTSMQLNLRGCDAWIELLDEPMVAKDIGEVWLCVRANTGEVNSVYWCRQGETYDESRVVHVAYHPGRHVQVIRFAVRENPNWCGIIHQLRVDVCNGPMAGGETAEVMWVRLVR